MGSRPMDILQEVTMMLVQMTEELKSKDSQSNMLEGRPFPFPLLPPVLAVRHAGVVSPLAVKNRLQESCSKFSL